MICETSALTCTFLQWCAGAHVDIINPDVACGCLFKDAFDDHLSEKKTKGFKLTWSFVKLHLHAIFVYIAPVYLKLLRGLRYDGAPLLPRQTLAAVESPEKGFLLKRVPQ